MRTSLRISWLLKYSASSTILNSANAWLLGPSDLPTQTLHAYSPGKCSRSPFRTNHEHRRPPFCALADRISPRRQLSYGCIRISFCETLRRFKYIEPDAGNEGAVGFDVAS